MPKRLITRDTHERHVGRVQIWPKNSNCRMDADGWWFSMVDLADVRTCDQFERTFEFLPDKASKALYEITCVPVKGGQND